MVGDEMPGGRPSKYDESRHPDLVRAHGARPVSDQDIAHELGIAYSTFNLWKDEHPEFSEALEEGRKKLLADVEHIGLYRKALGYDYEETRIETRIVAKGRNGQEAALIAEAAQAADENAYVVSKTVTRKHVVPDMAAVAFVLCNRDPARWQHVNRVELTGANGGPIQHEQVESLPTEDLIAEATAICQRAATAGADRSGAATSNADVDTPTD